MTTAVTRPYTVTACIDTPDPTATDPAPVTGRDGRPLRLASPASPGSGSEDRSGDDTDEAEEACGEATWGELFDDPTPVESLAGYLHGMAYGARLFGPDDSVATRAHIDRD
ncbi:hypothetical protein OG613_49010 (plasmid) [Streptomyces sp. NBC_00015]|uniref:hypothetical protein n=1 Tax=Streptomyces sp. NBC_00015 TaxID=2903611 RepID=UPI002F907C33